MKTHTDKIYKTGISRAETLSSGYHFSFKTAKQRKLTIERTMKYTQQFNTKMLDAYHITNPKDLDEKLRQIAKDNLYLIQHVIKINGGVFPREAKFELSLTSQLYLSKIGCKLYEY